MTKSLPFIYNHHNLLKYYTLFYAERIQTEITKNNLWKTCNTPIPNGTFKSIGNIGKKKEKEFRFYYCFQPAPT